MRYLLSIVICISFITCRNKELISKEYLLGIWKCDSLSVYKKGVTEIIKPDSLFVNFNEVGNRIYFTRDSILEIDFYHANFENLFINAVSGPPPTDTSIGKRTQVISKNQFVMTMEVSGGVNNFMILKEYFSRTKYHEIDEIFKYSSEKNQDIQKSNTSIVEITNPDLISMQNNTKEFVTDDRSSMEGVKLKLTIPKNWESKPLINNSAYVFGEPNYSIVTSIRVLDSYNYESDLSLSSIDSIKHMVSKSFNPSKTTTNSFAINNKKVFQVNYVSKQETGIGQLITGNNLYVFVSNRKMVLISYSIVRTEEKFKESEMTEFNILFNRLMSKTEILTN